MGQTREDAPAQVGEIKINSRNKFERTPDDIRPYKLHQVVCLTGVNLQRKSVVGLVELTLVPKKAGLKAVTLNCKQCKIYKITIQVQIPPPPPLQKSHPQQEQEEAKQLELELTPPVEMDFEYYDVTQEVTPRDLPNNQFSLDQFANHHREATHSVDPDAGWGELFLKIPDDVSIPYTKGDSAGECSFPYTFTIRIEYALENPESGMHFYVPDDPALGPERAHMFTTRHENSSRLWFPCIDSFSEVCTWELEFTVDEGLTAISCGDLLGIYQAEGRKKTYHYYLSVPTAAPNIGLAVGPFEVYVDPTIIEVTHFCLPGLMNLLKWTSRFLHEIFEYFEDLLATRFPYTSFKSVYVHEACEEMMSYASMCILDTNLLHTSSIIDQTYITRRFSALSLAEQYYSCFISIQHTSDAYLSKGISNYLCGLYLKKFFGNNEYRYWIHSELQEVIKYEQQYGGIVLDPSFIEKAVTGGNAGNICTNSNTSLQQAPRTTTNQSTDGGDSGFYFSLVNPQTMSPLYLKIMAKKAHLLIRMLEDRIGSKLLLEVFNKQLSLARLSYVSQLQQPGKTLRIAMAPVPPTSATTNQPAQEAKTSTPGVNLSSPMLISTGSFIRAIFTVTGKDMIGFFETWARQGGHARFNMSFVFNRKRNTVELELKQECLQQLGVKRYVGPLTVALQELDGTFKHVLQIEGTHAKADIVCHSKSRRQKKKKIPLCTGEEVDMDLNSMDTDSPVLWIRLDPEMTLIRAVDSRQPDFQWQYQLRHERDVTAQIEAITALETFPTQQTRMALTDLIENEQAFFKVRCEACHCLTKIANAMVSSWTGPPAMLNIFRKLFGSFSCPQIVKQNEFSNLQHYFLLKTIPVAMASLRNVHGICPSEVHKFLIDLFKFNDNSRNRFSDNYYRAALVASLGNTVTPVVSLLQPGSDITSESLSSDTRIIMEEISRCLNLEKMLHCYKFTVTIECLKALRKLQKFGHLPNHVELFKDYASYGQFHDVRIAALEAIVDYTKTDGKLEDVEYLLDMIDNDRNPQMRHDLTRLIVQCLSEKANDRRTKTKSPFHNHSVALRIWDRINYKLTNDARLRCDLVDLYYILFGTKKPSCLSDDFQISVSEEISSRRKSPLTVRDDIDSYKKDTEEMIVDVEQPIASAAAVLPSKRESMASDNSAELPDAMDTSLPTSFEPEMFKSDKDLPECQEVVIEAEDVKVHEVAKEVEVETGESSSQHKKHSHHHHSKAKKKKDKKKKHKHKHKHHKHSHEHKKKVKEETLSSASSASNSPAHN